jgi:hypothetical protein
MWPAMQPIFAGVQMKRPAPKPFDEDVRLVQPDLEGLEAALETVSGDTAALSYLLCD